VLPGKVGSRGRRLMRSSCEPTSIEGAVDAYTSRLQRMVIATASGPGVADVVTAAGTVATAVGAIAIAVVSYWRERTHTRRHEQFTAAYLVQVIQGERPATGQSGPDSTALVLVASVINHGPYTITEVEVQFCLDGGTLRPAANCERVSNFAKLPDALQKPGDVSEERAMHGVLTPWDVGMRAESDEVRVQELKAHYAVVSWTDQWGQRWQHGPGTVRRIKGSARRGA
jgi:hypothetical protein